MQPWRSSLLALACASCATTTGIAVDPDFAAHADMLQPEVDKDAKTTAVKLGSFTLEYLEPITSSMTKTDDKPPLATHKFSFELKNEKNEALNVSCDINIRWIDKKPDNSLRELVCELTGAQGKLPYKLVLTGTGPMLGLMTGSVDQGRQILTIDSSHGAPSGSRTVGPLLGFDISLDNRPIGLVQIVDPLTIWIDKRFPEEMRTLAAACAVALSFYDEVGSST